ncbi:MAG: hypothetical protein R2838_25200 [Caldilineaceae bacterium]
MLLDIHHAGQGRLHGAPRDEAGCGVAGYVIVISALDEIESAVRCIELGAEDYLPKPFDPVLLKKRLQATLEEKAS